MRTRPTTTADVQTPEHLPKCPGHVSTPALVQRGNLLIALTWEDPNPTDRATYSIWIDVAGSGQSCVAREEHTFRNEREASMDSRRRGLRCVQPAFCLPQSFGFEGKS